MKDKHGREIDYMRISITDKCNLRCKYCMPHSLPYIPHSDILRYEELMRICRAAVALGINRFKITGGEPLVRRGAADFITRLKTEPGVKCVTLTTNGILLSDMAPKLKQSGLNGVNISLNALDPAKYCEIAGSDYVKEALRAVTQCVKNGIPTKINCVLLSCNEDQYIPLAMLAGDMPVDVRFIEIMPIGYGRKISGPFFTEVFEKLKKIFTDLHYVNEKRGNGPAVYYRSTQLSGRIGFIGANSHKFCADCNRVRLTSTGMVKPCLCYDTSTDLRTLIRNGASDQRLVDALYRVIFEKPLAHCFSSQKNITEYRKMNQIGG